MQAWTRKAPFGWFAIKVGVALVCAVASAQADTETLIRPEYAAPADCPNASAFTSQLIARSADVRVAKQGERARALVVRINAERGRFVGRLVVRELDGAETERTVSGDTCGEVVAALAFVAATSIAPAAANASTSVDAGSGSSSPPPAASAAPSSTTARATPPPTDVGREAAPARGETPHGSPSSRSFVIAVGVDGRVVDGPGPTAFFTLPIFAELTGTSRETWSPGLRVAFDRGSTSGHTSIGSADFTWTAGAVDLCPAALLPGRFRGDLCLRTEIGVLDARGTGVEPPRSSHRPYVSVGPAVRGRWVFTTPFFVELEGSLGVPLVRDRFFLEPDVTVFRVPVAEVGAAAGLGLAVW